MAIVTPSTQISFYEVDQALLSSVPALYSQLEGNSERIEEIFKSHVFKTPLNPSVIEDIHLKMDELVSRNIKMLHQYYNHEYYNIPIEKNRCSRMVENFQLVRKTCEKLIPTQKLPKSDAEIAQMLQAQYSKDGRFKSDQYGNVAVVRNVVYKNGSPVYKSGFPSPLVMTVGITKPQDAEITKFESQVYNLRSNDHMELAAESKDCTINGATNTWIDLGESCEGITINLKRGSTLIVNPHCSNIRINKLHKECEVMINPTCRDVYLDEQKVK